MLASDPVRTMLRDPEIVGPDRVPVQLVHFAEFSVRLGDIHLGIAIGVKVPAARLQDAL